MVKVFTKSVAIICASILLVSCINCAPKATSPEVEKQVAIVQKGDLTVSISVDGNLVMPQAFDLLFGAPGDVEDVLVEEGDLVKAGQILARLDNTSQRLDIMSANNNVQTVLSNLYETVPRLPQFPSQLYTSTTTPPGTATIWNRVEIPGHPGIYGLVPSTVTTPGETTVTPIPNTLYSAVSYSYYYPSATALSSFEWAQDEVARAHELFQTDNYTAAASELYVAFSDLEACIKILEDTINNPQSGLGNTAPFVPDDEAGIAYLLFTQDQSFAVHYIVELREAVDLIRQGQAYIEMARELIAQERYEEADTVFTTLFKSIKDIGKVVINHVNVIKARGNTTVYGRDIGFYFYGTAEEKLDAALKGIEKGGLNSPELYDNLRIAQHYMRLCNAILGSNEYVLQHGLSLKNEQQYNIELAGALVSLGNKNDDFLKTIILAPFDGIVVSVDVKKNDVLSAIDYASKTAVQLVDTSQIKFEGEVDEIDILKIRSGQQATISVDAVPDKTFTGTVSFISPYGTADTNNVVKFPVTIQLDPTDIALKGGLTATADISIYSVENVLLVPLSAVTTTAEGSFVTVLDEATGRTDRRQVTLGGKNLQFAEVLSGLNEEDTVIIEEKVTGAPIIKGLPERSSSPPPSR